MEDDFFSYDPDTQWQDVLGENSFLVFNENHEVDKVASFKKYLKNGGYYLRYNALTERVFVAGPMLSLSGEISPIVFRDCVFKRYPNQFADCNKKEKTACLALINGLKTVTREIADPRFPEGIFMPQGSPVYVLNRWHKPVNETGTRLNSYEVKDALDAVLELFSRLFPVGEELDQVLAFIAHAFQRPEERPQWAMLIRGEGGNGKSTLFVRILRAIFGAHHVNEQHDLARIDEPETVSGWLSSMFVVCDDFIVSRKSQADDLKHLITAPRLESRRYYQNATQEDVFSRFIFLSNSREPLQFYTEDRRFFIPKYCEHFQDKEESARFIKEKIISLFEVGTSSFKDVRVKDALIDFFQTYPLDNFNSGVPLETEDHQNMSGAGGSTKRDQIQAFIDRYPIATLQSFKQYMYTEYGTCIDERAENIWEKLMRESPDGWIRVSSGKNARYKARITHNVGKFSKGKHFTGWCRQEFYSDFMAKLIDLYAEDAIYFAML